LGVENGHYADDKYESVTIFKDFLTRTKTDVTKFNAEIASLYAEVW